MVIYDAVRSGQKWFRRARCGDCVRAVWKFKSLDNTENEIVLKKIFVFKATLFWWRSRVRWCLKNRRFNR